MRLRRLILTRRSLPKECHILIGLKQNKGSEQSTAVTGINYLLPNGSQTQHSAILVLTLFLHPLSVLSSLFSPPHHVFVRNRAESRVFFGYGVDNYTEILD